MKTTTHKGDLLYLTCSIYKKRLTMQYKLTIKPYLFGMKDIPYEMERRNPVGFHT